MKFVVLFEDNSETSAAIRNLHMTDHLAFLERHASLIEAAGPLREPNGSAAGGIWIVEADTASAVQELVEGDPFWPTGLRKSSRIMEWNQVVANGKRCIQH